MNIYKKIDCYKAAIDEQRPFEGQLLKEIKNYYRIGLTWSSNAIEGNTFTESETKVLLEWAADERAKYHPVEFAAQLHKRFVFIHPFVDGNGRISRLLMNMVLIQDGYMLAVIPPVLRQEYISLLERAHKDDRPFMDFIAARVLESEKEIMRLLQIPFPELS
jgi:Uncharacterized conserved protein